MTPSTLPTIRITLEVPIPEGCDVAPDSLAMQDFREGLLGVASKMLIVMKHSAHNNSGIRAYYHKDASGWAVITIID